MATSPRIVEVKGHRIFGGKLQQLVRVLQTPASKGLEETPATDTQVWQDVVTLDTAIVSAVLGADVTMAAAANWYDGPSIVLTAGRWLVHGTAQFKSANATAQRVTVRLIDDAGVVYDAGEGASPSQGTSTAGYLRIPILGDITVADGTTKTVRLSARSTAANSVMTRNPGDNSPTVNNATKLIATRETVI